MYFASPLPWWLVVLVAAAIAGVAYFAYRRPLIPLSSSQRGGLMLLRALGLGTVVVLLCRPTVLVPPEGSTGLVVPVLIDVSRSMRIADADGASRLERAVDWVASTLVPQLSVGFTTEIYAVGDTLARASLDNLTADARQTDLAGALRAIREKSRGRPVSAVVLVSDGGDSLQSPESLEAPGPPVLAVGIGSADGVPDREIVGMVAGDPRLDQASVDLRVSAVARGFGRRPFAMHLSANGRLLETRTVTPTADGSPVEALFTVFPETLTPTVFRAEIDADPSEVVTENNSRSVLVAPPGRARRVLALEGAPGHDHSFFARAVGADPGLELDIVVRKGRNEAGEPTFFVRAGGARAAGLASGFPATRELLYSYDALVVANVDGDVLARAQLLQAAEFVSTRGGGLLVFGGRSLAQRGLIGTPLEDALPLELNDRRGGLARAALDPNHLVGHNGVRLTPEGESHPVMRLEASPADNQRRWSRLPPLAASAPLGGPKPGATVLALTAAQNGAVYPLVAVQRYGRGRSLVFAGEASWQWRMLLPSTDRSYEYFWRQALRWLVAPTPDAVEILVPEAAEPGASLTLGVDVRDATFEPATTAVVDVTVSAPGAAPQTIALRPEVATPGRWSAAFRPAEPGAYQIRAEARRGDLLLGSADRWLLVGGSDREFADPRLNEGFLRRAARATDGRYVRVGDAGEMSSWLRGAIPPNAALERRDVWHQPWALAFVVGVLSTEWLLRRRWGLR